VSNKVKITLPTPVSAAVMLSVLAHAKSMANQVTVIDARLGDVVIELEQFRPSVSITPALVTGEVGPLRVATPPPPAEVVASTDSGSVTSDEEPEPAPHPFDDDEVALVGGPDPVSHASTTTEAPGWDSEGEPDGPGSGDDRYGAHPAPEVAPACPDDPDGQHYVGCGCDDQDDDEDQADDADEAPAVEEPEPQRHQPGSVAWAILEEVAADGGRFEGSLTDLCRMLNRGTPGSVAGYARKLVADGLVVLDMAGARRVEAVRLTDDGWAHLGQAPPPEETEPEPTPVTNPAPDEDDEPEPDEPAPGWDHMRRTTRADREAAEAQPKRNLLDGPTSLPTADRIPTDGEVIEEIELPPVDRRQGAIDTAIEALQ
jgi:hypothetical protein